MCSMDKFFPGNIYHQFESICRDVDEFVTKDTLKFVENRVQDVGMTVKRFCSNVVQDILPLSGDIEEPKSELGDAEQVDMQDHVSIPDIDTNSTCISEKQVLLNQHSVHALGYSDDHIKQVSELPCGDLSPGAETSLHMAECSDAIIQNGEESGVEEDITRGSIPVSADSCLEPLDNEVFSEVSDEDHDHSALALSSSPAFPSHEVDLATLKEETQHFNHKKGNKSDSYDPVCLSDSSSNGKFLDSTLTLNEGNRYSDENGSLSPADKVNEDNSLLMDSPLPSACDANASALVKDGVLSDHFTAKDDNFHVSTSVAFTPECMLSLFSWEGKEVETGIPPHCCVMESTSVDSIMKTEKICPLYSKRDDLALNISTPSPITAPDETKDVDVLPSFLILKSNEGKEVETGITPPCCCVMESTSAGSIMKSENICPIHSKRDGLAVNISTLSPITAPDETKDVDVLPSFLILKSNEGKEVETDITPPCCCVMESTSVGSIMKTENICPVHSERDCLAVNISNPSSITVPVEAKDVDVLPSFMIWKSNDFNVTQTDKSELVNASSNRHKHHKDGHSEMLMSPSETANTCCDFDMETVDLSSGLKDNGTIPVSKSSCVHAASRRRGFRYYKNLIHDAFTSQKRISKEYEHLAILYGDIDMKSNQLFKTTSAPSDLDTHAVKTQSSEWELISTESFI